MSYNDLPSHQRHVKYLVHRSPRSQNTYLPSSPRDPRTEILHLSWNRYRSVNIIILVFQKLNYSEFPEQKYFCLNETTIIDPVTGAGANSKGISKWAKDHILPNSSNQMKKSDKTSEWFLKAVGPEKGQHTVKQKKTNERHQPQLLHEVLHHAERRAFYHPDWGSTVDAEWPNHLEEPTGFQLNNSRNIIEPHVTKPVMDVNA